MIWSVSTSARSSTLTGPDTMRTGSISSTSSRRRGDATAPGADVDEAALDGGVVGHLGRDEVRAPPAPLPALEVAVRGGGAALARRQDVGVHPEAHRAARAAPLEARRLEDLAQALLLRLVLHPRGAGDDDRLDAARDATAGYDVRRRAQVLDARVRA